MEQRPVVAVAHITLETDRMGESARFIRAIGMRPIFEGNAVAVYELRGGTHLILQQKDSITPGDAPFDLMVDDLHETHRHLTALGLAPSPIESRPAIDHEVFYLQDPSGWVITFFSSHTSGKPV
ncbi:catechol-2,3-dioxygenase [Chitinivorax tropicus]|uniref:Catechol-2,3-dioxygenase n=1 Tax=Chitinivorax tropicus TaxID=714531 RepID=A0A840MSS9_9PROT|nr:VOC family protein [Chitinivorax tropicus]MBB5020237.1 catechol-2,3-dioxygenase [Chitinivorax tropicus]